MNDTPQITQTAAEHTTVVRLTPAPDLRECHVTVLESGPGPAGWSTELNKPLLGHTKRGECHGH